MSKSAQKGFTLVELLVVIAIIAVLAVVGLVVFRGVTAGARDAKRRVDIDSIAKAYEAQMSGGYVALTNENFSSGKIPQDPSKGDYFNWLDSTGAGFKICASLDNNPSNVCNTPAQNCYCKFSSQGTIPSGSTAHASSTQASFGLGGPSQQSCDPNGILLAGLVGYWKMDETASPFSDYSGNNNIGTWAGGVSAVSGVRSSPYDFKNAGSFNGTTSYVGAGNNPSLQMNTTLTVGLWLYPQSTVGLQKPIAKGVAWLNGWWIQSNNGTSNFRFNFVGPSGTYASTVTTLNPNAWTHFVVTYNAGAVKIYKNGTQVVSETSTQTSISGTSSSNLEIGRESGGSYYFNGRVDDVRIYNRVLSGGSSDSEISNLYNGGDGCL